MYEFLNNTSDEPLSIQLYIFYCVVIFSIIFVVWRYKIWAVLGRILFSLFCLSFLAIIFQDVSLEKSPKQKENDYISLEEAENFMREQCESSNQTLVRTHSVDFDGQTIYMFLSVTENGYACITGISEHKLEILNSDCGTYDEKMSDWNNL